MIRLPKLLLGDDLERLVALTVEIEECGEPLIEIDAAELVMAEPVALCLLARSLEVVRRRGQRALVRQLDPRTAAHLQRFDVLAPWLATRPQAASEPQTPIQVAQVANQNEANAVANVLMSALASYVPLDDIAGHLEGDDAQARRYRNVEQPMGYVSTELLDNALIHGRSAGFGHARAWVAAQYYLAGDLLRVAVVDDGCGFLASLRSSASVEPKSDDAAVRAAFRPHVSSKRDVGLFRDAVHQGIGLTVCRDLCARTGGSLDVASGGCWIRDPGMPTERTRLLRPRYQGAALSLTLHRRALTPNLVAVIVERYAPTGDLPVRFI